VQIPLNITLNYHARAKQSTASLPKDSALAILKELGKAERMMWTERVRGPKAGMVIHQIMMEQAHAWVWHEEPGERQPTTAAQPPPATKFHCQPDLTPRVFGTWAAENRGGRMLCQAYQQIQCAGNSCSVGAHVCAMVVRDSGHVFGTKHPACKHRWDKKAAEQESRRISKRNRRRWGPAVGMDDNSQPEVGQKQAAVAEQYLDYLDSMSQSGSYSRHHGS